MNNPVWQDPKLLKLWMLCLLEATHKEHELMVGTKIVRLHPGQFVTGRFSLAAEYNRGTKKKDMVPETTLWRWLKLFETYGFLNIKSTTKYSVITVLNWGFYQNIDQQMNNKWTANGQQMVTNNNGNKEREEEEGETMEIKNIPFEQIQNKFIERRGRGFDLSPEDESAINRLLEDKIPVEKIIQWIDEIFNAYKPKHRLDTIKRFAYLEKGILDRWAELQKGEPKIKTGSHQKLNDIDWENL